MDRAPSDGRTVAVVDDDESIRAALRSLLRSFGFPVEAFPSAEEFLRCAWMTRTSCLIVDIRMPGLSGLDLQRWLIAAGYRLPTIFISAHDDPAVRRAAERGGARAFLRKPFGEETLLDAVRAALTPCELLVAPRRDR